MKKYTLPLTVVLGSFLCVMRPATSSAHDGDYNYDDSRWDAHHHYRVDDDGYWDEHRKHHAFIFWHKHHGYWDERGDKRIFIRVD